MKTLLVVLTSLATASAAALSGYWCGQADVQRASPLASSNDHNHTVVSPDGNSRVADAIVNLDRRLATLELKQAIDSTSATAPEAPPSEPTAPQDLQALSELEQDREAKMASVIETKLKTESRDRNWASAVEDQLNDAVKALADEGAHLSISTLKCFTSICELVLSATTSDDAQRSTYGLGRPISGTSGFNLRPPVKTADGSSKMIYTFFREGYPRAP